MYPENTLDRAIERDRIDIYGADAKLYDAFFSSDTAERNKEYSARRNVPEDSEVLDLACGTGSIISRLEEDYDIIGADISKQMLEIASENTDSELVQADMTDLPFENEFEAVLMYGHPISHLEGYENVQRTFEPVYHALGDDGILVMDFLTDNIGKVSLETREQQVGAYQVKISPEFQNYNPATHSADYIMRFQIENDGSVQEIEHQSAVQGFSSEELKYLLEEAGFDSIKEQRVFDSEIQKGLRAEKGEPEDGEVLGFGL